MSMDNLTPAAQQAITAATRIANALQHRQVLPEHLFIGLFTATQSEVTSILSGYGLRASVAESHLAAIAPPGSVPPASSLFSDEVRAIIAAAHRDARNTSANVVDPNGLARAILASGAPRVIELLRSVSVTPEIVLSALDAAAPVTPTTDEQPGREPELAAAGGVMEPSQQPTPAAGVGKTLATFGQNWVERAANGDFDPVTGRDTEIERVIVSLGRRTKNNPCLVGAPGVGKTAVVEGLAQRMAAGTVPEHIANRPLISLDLGAMVAGSRFRGDFEERLKSALDEAVAANAILFLDEIHNVVGAGAASGSMDAANMLKPMIARGEVSILGATTLDEYRSSIEKDTALERRFQPVQVGEPSVGDTVAILSGLRHRYATHHRVNYTDSALTAAATLADRYISDRFLPDKAIDVLDEAGARAGMRILTLEAPVRELYTQRGALRTEIEKTHSAGDYGKASELALAEASLTERILADGGADLSVVSDAQIADVVAAITGVPVNVIGEEESERLRQLDTRLGLRVVGQAAAVDAVSRAVRRVRLGVAAGTRPTSFIFAGPTGVGKTELSKALAEDLFGVEASGQASFVHLDMSEYAEKQSVSRLIGAAPGYVGFGEGGQLTEAVRRKPFSVVLFDEIEKAHPDVFDTLLQVLEDGRLTDSQGRAVNFKNTILILTTNLGGVKQARPQIGFTDTSETATQAAAERATADALKAHFWPEFLNRIDEVVTFRSLSRDDLSSIVSNLLTPTRAQLAERGVDLELTDAAVTALLAAGYDPAMGARPLRRTITRMLLDALTDQLLAGDLRPGMTAFADVNPADPKGRLVITGMPGVDGSLDSAPAAANTVPA